jgi:two-component system nitrogen regulation sensor histidine kinase NtrY
MSLRTRLVLLFTISIGVCVGLVTWIATLRMRAAFEATDAQHTAALVAQFRQEFQRQGEEVTSKLDSIASRDSTVRVALEAARPLPDFSTFVDEARSVAEPQHLDFLEFVAQDGTIISSAQWPARFGYKEEWLTRSPADWGGEGAFLKREEMPEGPVLALIGVRPIRVAESTIYVVGGIRLDRQFLGSLVLPHDMRALLYTNTSQGFAPQSLQDSAGPIPDAAPLQPFIQQLQADPREISRVISWPHASSETIQAFPLRGRDNELLAILLVASSRHDLLELEVRLRRIAIIVGGLGVLAGLILSLWVASHVTRPVEQLAMAASDVAAGNWDTQVEVSSCDEIGQLADAFNQMTTNLVEQRDRLVQTERVAAWRELARRLAHELKNPLFPLQITVENLLRAREQSPEQFDEVFRESTGTLLDELGKLKAIIGRFSDFAKMPTPQLQSVDVNELVRRALKLYEAQFAAPEKPAITARVDFAADPATVQADPDLLHRAVSNLILNAMDAMPNGGTLTVRTSRDYDSMNIEIGDTGTGLTKEECERLFTPYYTTKQHGTGLGLAIVQSVIADHHGKISVESEPKRGTTFHIELPLAQPAGEIARGANVQ